MKNVFLILVAAVLMMSCGPSKEEYYQKAGEVYGTINKLVFQTNYLDTCIMGMANANKELQAMSPYDKDYLNTQEAVKSGMQTLQKQISDAQALSTDARNQFNTIQEVPDDCQTAQQTLSDLLDATQKLNMYVISGQAQPEEYAQKYADVQNKLQIFQTTFPDIVKASESGGL